MSDTWPTVAETIEALKALPEEVQGYAVWIEADPSAPIDRPEHWVIDHGYRRVWL